MIIKKYLLKIKSPGPKKKKEIEKMTTYISEDKSNVGKTNHVLKSHEISAIGAQY